MLGTFSSDRLAHRAPWLLMLLALVLLAPGTGTLPLLDRDEPRFAGATVEMMQRHEWVVPYFNGEYRFDKPVLTYWLMRGGYALFGVGELGARAHSVLAAMLLALVVFHIGRRWFSARVGGLAAGMLLFSLQMLIHGRSAVADMPMVLFVALSQWALWELLQKFSWRWFWVFHLSLGAGFLAKGPIAWAVPLLSALLFRFVFARAPQPWRNLKLLRGLPVVLLVVGAWGIPALLATHGDFWRVGMGEHVMKRGFAAFDGRRFVPFYYLPSALFSLFPWIACVGFGWAELRRSWDAKQAFLVSWLLAPYLIFTLYSTQLPHYVLPAIPAFFLILAHAAGHPGLHAPRWAIPFRAFVFGLMGTAVVALAAAGCWARPGTEFAPLRGVLWGAAALGTGLLIAGGQFRHPRGRWLTVAALTVAAGLGTLGFGLRQVLPAVKLQGVFARMPAGTEFLCYRFREPTLVFYSGRRWALPDTREELAAALARPGPRLAVVIETQVDAGRLLKAKLAEWMGRGSPMEQEDFSAENTGLVLPGYRAEFVEGLNVAKGQWVRLKVIYRAGL